MRLRNLLRSAIILASFISLASCHKEVFFLESGFHGPVAIKFGCTNGTQVEPSELGRSEFHVGPTGILLLRSELPAERWVTRDFFWVKKDGSLVEIPYEVGTGDQVFWFQVGGASTAGNVRRGAYYFFVGDVNKREQLGSQLDVLRRRASELCKVQL